MLGTHQSVLMVQMKNWEPLVLGPAFAMDRTPEKQARVSHAAAGSSSPGVSLERAGGSHDTRTRESEEDQAPRTGCCRADLQRKERGGSSRVEPGQDPPLGFSHCTVGLKADTMLRFR